MGEQNLLLMFRSPSLTTPVQAAVAVAQQKQKVMEVQISSLICKYAYSPSLYTCRFSDGDGHNGGEDALRERLPREGDLRRVGRVHPHDRRPQEGRHGYQRYIVNG